MTEPNLKPLEQLATEHGQIAPVVAEGNKYLCEHRVAAQVHNWAHHEFHYGPVLLTDDDYKAALVAAMNGAKHEPAVPTAPSDDELKAKHDAALLASTEPEQVAKRAAAAAKEAKLAAADRESAFASSPAPLEAHTNAPVSKAKTATIKE